jgi:hypothetical protein
VRETSWLREVPCNSSDGLCRRDVVARLEQRNLGQLVALGYVLSGSKQGESAAHDALSAMRWTDAGFIGILPDKS